MKSKKINIHLITSLDSGGAQKVLYDYLSSLNKNRVDQLEVYSLRSHDFYSGKIESLGFEVIHLNNLSNCFRFISTVFLNRGYFKAWMYHACFLSLLAKLNFNRNIYWSIHHGHVDIKSDSLSTITFAKACAFFSWFVPKKTIFVSQSCMDKHVAFGFKKKHSIVVYNNVELSSDSFKSASDRNVISFIGRDHPNKNIGLFLAACEKINKNKKYEFIIAGKGTRRHSSNYGSNFHFLDEVECVEDVYSNTKVYVCTSYTESFGLTIIEAILAGCNVVCPLGPVFKEVTCGGGGNVYYYRQDNLESLIEAINSAMNSENVDLEFIDLIRYRYSKESTINNILSVLGDN